MKIKVKGKPVKFWCGPATVNEKTSEKSTVSVKKWEGRGDEIS